MIGRRGGWTVSSLTGRGTAAVWHGRACHPGGSLGTSHGYCGVMNEWMKPGIGGNRRMPGT